LYVATRLHASNSQAFTTTGPENTKLESTALLAARQKKESIIPQSRIVKMDRECLRTGDRATITLQFMQYPEYVKPGTQLVFRDGRTKAVGKVRGLCIHLVPSSILVLVM
jgi:hypothetical protein